MNRLKELMRIGADITAKRAKGNSIFGVAIHPKTLSEISKDILKADPDYIPGDLITELDGVNIYASYGIIPGAHKIILSNNELNALVGGMSAVTA